MKCIKVYLGNEPRNIEIVPFADLHIGSPKFAASELQKRIDYVKESENRYAILLGDICNCTTKDSVGDIYDEEMSPMEQIKYAIAVFEPIKDRILCITNGNHERRAMRSGTDLGWLLAKSLGLEDKYDYASCLLFVRFGHVSKNHGGDHVNRRVLYTIYCTHGDGTGGRLVGSKANGLERRGNIVNADIIVVGHTHQPLTFKQSAFEIDYANSNVKVKETTYVNCGSSLNYEQYAELVGMRPSSKANPIIKLNGSSRKEVQIML